MRFRFEEIDGFARVYDKTRYLVVFGNEKYDFIYNRIRYFISIKVDLHDSLPLAKITTFYNFIILIQSIFSTTTNYS